MPALGWVPRGLRLFLAGAVAAVALWAAGLVWFAETMPDSAPTPVVRTDAIVVLTGGSERLGEGLKLLLQKRSKHLFVSGVHPGVTIDELLRVYHVDPAHAGANVTVGYRAGNTQGNAEETAEWMKSHGFRSLRLVTANYHMRRSLLEFSQAMPDVEIVTHPVFPDPVYPLRWWRSFTALSVVASEYNKYLVALLRYWLSGPPLPAVGEAAADVGRR